MDFCHELYSKWLAVVKVVCVSACVCVRVYVSWAFCSLFILVSSRPMIIDRATLSIERAPYGDSLTGAAAP